MGSKFWRQSRKQTLSVFATFLLLTFVSFRKALTTSGTLGHRIDWFLPSHPYQLVQLASETLYVWKTFALGWVSNLPTTVPFELMLGWFGSLGFSGELVSKALIVIVISAAGCTMYLYAKELFGSTNDSMLRVLLSPAFLAGLFYSFSPVVFNHTVDGHVYYLVSYMILPLGLLFYQRSVNQNKIEGKYVILAALCFSIAAIQNQFAVMLLAIFLLYTPFTDFKKSRLKALFGILGIAFLLQLYWTASLLLNFGTSLADFSKIRPPSSVSEDKWLLLSLVDSFTLVGYFIPWFKEALSPFWLVPWYFVSYLLIAIAFSALMFLRKSKYVLLSIIMILGSLFLITGAGFSKSVNVWVYDHFLPLHLFRSVHHLLFLPAFFYAVLIGAVSTHFRKSYSRKVYWVFAASLVALILIYEHPILSGDLKGNLQTFKDSPTYRSMDDVLKREEGDYRVLYLPMTSFPIFTRPVSIHAKVKDFPGADPLISSSMRPTLATDIARWDNAKVFSIALETAIYDGATEEIRDLLKLGNIRYIILRSDVRHAFEQYGVKFWQQKDAYRKLLDILQSQSGIRLVTTFYDASLWENTDNIPHIYASPSMSLISSHSGGIDSLVPLTFTHYLNGYPAIAFSEQQNEDSLLMLIGRGQKAKDGGTRGAEGNRLGVGNERLEVRGQRSEAVEKTKEHLPTSNQVLFANSNFNDLVIDLAKAEAQPDSRQSTVGSQMPILVKLNDKGKGKFKVEGVGIYEVWVKSSQGLEDESWRLEVGGQGLEVNIDGEELEGGEGREGDKWIKAGEVELDKGKHRITVASQQSAVRNLDKEKFKKIVQNLEIVIISKEKQKEYEDLFKSKDMGYLFYVDKENIEDMLKDKERLKDIKVKKDNPFRIGEQEFYVPEDGSYSVKALVKPKRDFLESGFVSSSSIRASLDTLSGWDIKALNTTYKQNISEDGMHIDAYFQNRGDVKESVVLTKKFPEISIKERPYLAFSCEMNDVDVQEIELDIMTSDPSNKKVKKITLRADNKQYVINLYEKAKKAIGERQEARGEKIDLFVNEVVLKFKKKDGLDLSREKNRRIYSFVFKNLAFLKTHPILAGFEDKLSTYLHDKYYYFDVNGDLRSVDFLEQIPWDIKDVHRLHLNRFIDLKETPVLSLNFPKPIIDKNIEAERRDFSQEWKVVLGLDFNGDGKEDDSMEMFVPAAGLIDRELLLSVRAYEEAKKKFPDKQNYNLLFIGVSHPDDKEMSYQSVMSKKLIRYREHIYQPLEVRGERVEAKGAGVLEVDGKIYKLPPKVKGVRQEVRGGRLEVGGKRLDTEGQWVEFGNVYLKKGEHSLKVLENDKFKVEMVEIKPEVRGERLEVGGGGTEGRGGKGLNAKDQSPVIEFKKINPTRYVVNVKGAKNPFTLVFSESFHEGWKAYIRHRSEVRGQRLEEESEKQEVVGKRSGVRGGRLEARDERLEGKDERLFQTSNLKPQTFSKEPWSALWTAWKDRGKMVEIKDHFVVNGYANGWIVPVGQVTGQRLKVKGEENTIDFQIVLEYRPQRLFEIGLIISAATLLGCIGYLGYDFRKRRKGNSHC